MSVLRSTVANGAVIGALTSLSSVNTDMTMPVKVKVKFTRTGHEGPEGK